MFTYFEVLLLFIVFVDTTQSTTTLFLLKRRPRSVLQPDTQPFLIKTMKGPHTAQYDFSEVENEFDNIFSALKNKEEEEEKYRCKQRFASIYGQKLKTLLCKNTKRTIVPLVKKIKKTTLIPIQDLVRTAELFLDSRDENFDRSGTTTESEPQYDLPTQESAKADLQKLYNYLEKQKREEYEKLKITPVYWPAGFLKEVPFDKSAFAYDYFYERKGKPIQRYRNFPETHSEVPKTTFSKESMSSGPFPKYNSKNKYAAMLLDNLKTLKYLDQNLKGKFASQTVPTQASNEKFNILDKVALPTIPERILEYDVYDFIDSTEDPVIDNKVDTIYDDGYKVGETFGQYKDARRQRLPHFLPKRTYYTADQARQLRQFWFTNTVRV